MAIERLRVSLAGAVQGVGFRPFVYRLATQLQLQGWVLNSSAGLVVEVEGPRESLDVFQERLDRDKPAAALVLAREVSWLDPVGLAGFEIRKSEEEAEKTAGLVPDLATCPACLAELRDPANRRFGYAFTNCTACGPRYTIVLDIPYDRPNTTMRSFRMCPECQGEYTSPEDRRFHAQPNACPVCGPRVWVETSPVTARKRASVEDRTLTFAAPIRAPNVREGLCKGTRPPGHSTSPVERAVLPAASVGETADVAGLATCSTAGALSAGRIVALKGIGGFQLLVDARNEDAVARLRLLKHREEKPLALLVPSLEVTRQLAYVSKAEEDLLRSPAAPIVLLRPRPGAGIAPNVARSSPYLGCMLPYSPLHHLLMDECGFPLVATSGNRSDEPIAIENLEAIERLGEIADLFLMHDRPIARPCDDSVVRVARGRESVLRRARGYAPLPVRIAQDLPPVLAVGGHLKNSVAIARGRQVYVSQHVGDLDTAEARAAFERAIEDLCRLYRFEPTVVACDLHPDYASTRWARERGLPVIAVQHHQAHVASCAAENDLRGDYLGVGWDGTGFGLDGSIWGGEFFLVRGGIFERVAHLRPFRLPGGEKAIREGWRASAGLLYEAFGAEAVENPVIRRMLERGVNSPLTTSVGRLFDAVACMAGVARVNRFEGQAAMQLERAIGSCVTQDCYPLSERDGVADWAPLVEAVSVDVRNATAVDLISARFHNALAGWIVNVARRTGVGQVALSGGVFQNSYLVERSVAELESNGFKVATHQRVPANDGGIALGQAVIAGLATQRG